MLNHDHVAAQWKDEELCTRLGFRLPKKQDSCTSSVTSTPEFIQEGMVLPEGALESDPLALDASSSPLIQSPDPRVEVMWAVHGPDPQTTLLPLPPGLLNLLLVLPQWQTCSSSSMGSMKEDLFSQLHALQGEMQGSIQELCSEVHTGPVTQVDTSLA